eukprot:scaffold34725_cov30-Tisochrysis_lutea.AAC.1
MPTTVPMTTPRRAYNANAPVSHPRHLPLTPGVVPLSLVSGVQPMCVQYLIFGPVTALAQGRRWSGAAHWPRGGRGGVGECGGLGGTVAVVRLGVSG